MEAMKFEMEHFMPSVPVGCSIPIVTDFEAISLLTTPNMQYLERSMELSKPDNNTFRRQHCESETEVRPKVELVAESVLFDVKF